jgi:AraC family transcriptional regulator of adaptative response / DNA-3-methyladenine glycosylase II
MSPSRLRGAADDDAAPADSAVTIKLAYRAPCDAARLLKFIAQRAIPGIESVDGLSIRRTLRAGCVADMPGWLDAEFVPERSQLRLSFAPGLAPASARLVGAVRRWLDLDAAPQAIDSVLESLPGEAGLRLPGSVDAFELAVRAVLGQQVTVAAARTLARRVVERFGTPLVTPWPELDRAFPAPERIAALAPERIAELGIIRNRANAIVALAQAWPALAPQLDGRHAPETLIDALCALPGIGPWTAHYIAMRALSWPDAFPPHDVAVLKAMKQLFDTGSQREADRVAEAWRPWRAYAVLRLWNSLEKTT